MTDVEEDTAALLGRLELQALILDECRVKRGRAEDATPGDVQTDLSVAIAHGDPIVFTVRTLNAFHNQADDMIAEIEASFSASYTYTGDRPTERAVQNYAREALMIQVLPFVREFLASMTNRLGLTPFYLPLFGPAAEVLRTAQQVPPGADRG